MDYCTGEENVEKSQTLPADKVDIEERLQEATPVREQLDSNSNYQNQIEYQGFENSNVMNNEEVGKYLTDNLPPEHLRSDRITQIRYTDEYDGDKQGTVLGVCQTDKETGVSDIRLNRQTPEGSINREMMEHTLVHEVGHNVYYNMGEQKISSWEQISSNSAPKQYVSNYARTNVREDFAESYATFVRDPILLQEVSPQKFAFMKLQVFGGREYGY